MKLRQALAFPLVLSFMAASCGTVFAQQAGTNGPDFDPVTRALSSKNPTLPDPNNPGATQAPLTPEQQAIAAQQAQMAEIQAKREEARKKREAEEQARKAKEEADKQAEAQRMAALKAAREAKDAETKHNREELTALLEEEKTARKAYEDSKQSATGDSVKQVEDDYNKAEKDRQAKIKELRHPKYKPLKDYMPGANGTTALPGTVTSGSGPTVTQH